MKYIAFTIMVLILLFIFIKREKIDKNVAKNVVIVYFLSIPTIVLVLLFFKVVIKTVPNKHLVTTIYPSYLVISLIIFSLYLSKVMTQKLISFHISIDNENKRFIKTLIYNQNKIISVTQIAFLLGGVMAMYGLYIAEPI